MDELKLEDDINEMLPCLTKIESRLLDLTEMRQHYVNKGKRSSVHHLVGDQKTVE